MRLKMKDMFHNTTMKREKPVLSDKSNGGNDGWKTQPSRRMPPNPIWRTQPPNVAHQNNDGHRDSKVETERLAARRRIFESEAKEDEIRVINCRKHELRKIGYETLQQFLGADKSHVYVGRDMTDYVPGAKGSKWRNPFTLKANDGDGRKVVDMYKDYIRNTPHLYNSLKELKGKTLACWCHPAPCHATALKELYEEKFRVPDVASLTEFPVLSLSRKVC